MKFISALKIALAHSKGNCEQCEMEQSRGQSRIETQRLGRSDANVDCANGLDAVAMCEARIARR